MKSLANFYGVGSALLATLLSGHLVSTAMGAGIIYDNSTGDLDSSYSSPNEFGDEVVFGGASDLRTISKFTFEYFGIGEGGTANVTLRFYLNDVLSNGFYAPGTLLWTSDPFQVGATPRATVAFEPNVFIGKGGMSYNNFTWTVQFTDISGGSSWGLDIYDPPTVGYSYDDYWEHDALGEWLLKTNKFNVPMNFAARVEAVPEPNAMVLGIAGALAILLFRASIRRV